MSTSELGIARHFLHLLKQSIMASRAEELLQHKVVRVLPLVKQHGRSEADGADEERQPEQTRHFSAFTYIQIQNPCTAIDPKKL